MSRLVVVFRESRNGRTGVPPVCTLSHTPEGRDAPPINIKGPDAHPTEPSRLA